MRFLLEFFQRLIEGFKIGGRDIGQGIEEAINFGAVFYLPTPLGAIPIPIAVIGIEITVLFLLVFAIFYRSHLKVYNISVLQALSEKLFSMVENACKQNHLNEKQTKFLAPYIVSVGTFITLSNLISLIKVAPPAGNPAFPIALGLFTLLFVIVVGIHFVGIRGFLLTLLYPKAALLPFNILDYFIKPISLAFRLFGNIFGAYILIEFISLVVPLLVPTILGLWFDVGDGIIQGLVFAYLTLNYVGEIVVRAEEMQKSKETAIQEEKRLSEI